MILGVSLIVALWSGVAPHSLPQPTGPNAVGTAVKLYTDPSRPDPLDKSQKRQILVQFWYPAKPARGLKPYPYMSAALLGAMRKDEYLNVDVKLLDGWDSILTHSFYGAWAKSVRMPMLLLAPGMGMSRASYTTIAEELASRGIITALADHPYCGLAIYPDGLLRAYTRVKTKPEERVRQIALDQSFILHELRKHSPAHLRIDWSRITVGGHSIGGAAALQTGRSDATIRSVIDLDGDPWGEVEQSGTRKPFLVMLNEPGPPVHVSPRMKSERLGEWKQVLAISPVPAMVLTVGPAYHFTFSDVPFLLPADELRKSGATLDPSLGLREIADCISSYMGAGREGVEQFAKGHANVKWLIKPQG